MSGRRISVRHLSNGSVTAGTPTAVLADVTAAEPASKPRPRGGDVPAWLPPLPLAAAMAAVVVLLGWSALEYRFALDAPLRIVTFGLLLRWLTALVVLRPDRPGGIVGPLATIPISKECSPCAS
jgi:hypothetical protein